MASAATGDSPISSVASASPDALYGSRRRYRWVRMAAHPRVRGRARALRLGPWRRQGNVVLDPNWIQPGPKLIVLCVPVIEGWWALWDLNLRLPPCEGFGSYASGRKNRGNTLVFRWVL